MMVLSSEHSFVRLAAPFPIYKRNGDIPNNFYWFGTYQYVAKTTQYTPDVYINYSAENSQRVDVYIQYSKENLQQRSVYTTARTEYSCEWAESYVISMLVVQELQETSWWSCVNK